ncbi:MAG: ATP-binding protein [Candidatus Hodarchaeota archaeon]
MGFLCLGAIQRQLAGATDMLLANPWSSPDFSWLVNGASLVFEIIGVILFHVWAAIILLFFASIVWCRFIARRKNPLCGVFGRKKRLLKLLAVWFAYFMLPQVSLMVRGISFTLPKNAPVEISCFVFFYWTLAILDRKMGKEQFIQPRREGLMIPLILLLMDVSILPLVQRSELIGVLAWILNALGLLLVAISVLGALDTRYGRGNLVDANVLRVIRFPFIELVSVLKVKALNVNINYQPNELESSKMLSSDYIAKFLEFFYLKIYVLLSKLGVRVSFNILFENKSFEMYLVLQSRSFLLPSAEKRKTMHAALQKLSSAMASGAKFRFEALENDRMATALGKLVLEGQRGNGTPFQPWYSREGIFSKKGLHYAMLRFDFKEHLTESTREHYKQKVYMNDFVEAILKEGVPARFFFNLAFSRLRHVPFRMKKEEQQLLIQKDEETTKNERLLERARVSCGLVAFSKDPGEIEGKVEDIAGIMTEAFEVHAVRATSRWASRRMLGFNHDGIIVHGLSNLLAYRFLHFPTMLSGTQAKTFDFSIEAPPAPDCGAGSINIGKALTRGGGSRDFLLQVADLRKHVFINGGTGTGKSSFVQNLLKEILARFPAMPFMLIELKGEYEWLKDQYPGVEVLQPGLNFGINMFEPAGDPHVHAEMIYDLLQTSFDFTTANDFSPQMEKILVDLIHITCSQKDPARRSIDTFFEIAKAYIKKNKDKVPFIDKSWIAIENRIRRVIEGPLKPVFETTTGRVTMAEIHSKRVIIDLSSIIKLGGTKDDLYFFANMMFKSLWDHNLAKEPSRGIDHLTIVDDAQYFHKESREKEKGKSSYFEDIALLLRGKGEVLVSVSTRPEVSHDVLANCGLMVCFQTKFREDVYKLQGLLHLSENQNSLLEILPEHVSLVKVNSYPYPFLVETRTLFDRDGIGVKQSSGTSLHPDDASNRSIFLSIKKFFKKHFVKIRVFGRDVMESPRLVSIKRDFLNKVKQYYELKDRKWENWQGMTRDDIELLEMEIYHAKAELETMVHDNPNLQHLVSNAGRLRPRIIYLERLEKEI